MYDNITIIAEKLGLDGKFRQFSTSLYHHHLFMENSDNFTHHYTSIQIQTTYYIIIHPSPVYAKFRQLYTSLIFIYPSPHRKFRQLYISLYIHPLMENSDNFIHPSPFIHGIHLLLYLYSFVKPIIFIIAN